MQYLSKAYNYYSGINPATLSGAIDVIVVRHVDENGEVSLSSSPFHVRFGKLQVVRAGDKRVTLHLPNNLPAPHAAPFSMKVSETGEAFFVFETEAEVPAELLTSPVVMAEDSGLPPTPPPSDQAFLHPVPADNETAPEAGPSLTQNPFGATEQVVDHKHNQAESIPSQTQTRLGEVDFLDLNAENERRNSDGMLKDEIEISRRKSTESLSASVASAVSPSSILNTATSMLPSIPFLSSASSSKSNSPGKKSPTGPNDDNATSGCTDPLPNPLAAQPGESTEMPERDRKLSEVGEQVNNPSSSSITTSNTANQTSDEILPKVKAGDGEGPTVIYAKDIVLDMGGYHASGVDKEEPEIQADIGMQKAIEMVEKRRSQVELAEEEPESDHRVVESPGFQSSLLETFTLDLLTSAKPLSATLDSLRPATLVSRQTDPSLPRSAFDVSRQTEEAASSDLPSALASLDLESDHPETQSTSSPRRRFDRGQSEPPESMTRESTPSSTPIPQRFPIMPSSPGRLMGRTPNGALVGIHRPSGSTAEMDYAWDWGRFPKSSEPSLTHRKNEGDVDDLPVVHSEAMERASTDPIIPGSEREERKLPHPAEFHHLNAQPALSPGAGGRPTDLSIGQQGKLKNIEEDPYMFVLEMEGGRSHVFELSLCGTEGFALGFKVDDDEETSFLKHRVTFQKFIEDPHLVDDPRLVIRYSLFYLTWTTGYRLLFALAMYRRSLLPPTSSSPTMPPLSDIGLDSKAPRPSSGYGWSRWWRRGQSSATSSVEPPQPRRSSVAPTSTETVDADGASLKVVDSLPIPVPTEKHYAKTLRLSSDQLKQLNLKSGPNTVQFSVTSSFSGLATCTARIFLWDDKDQVVISDIDGTITKSDALGHVFAAIGRDWTHLGIAKLYTDICNNGYKILYLTSRAIGQADSTREYLKTINQGEYRLPEGPVIMSPDRLMTSFHREVILRKPELFKMACLRDIQRLFGDHAKDAFFAGFGNRITDAMSYRSVGIEASKIYTIDSTGVVKTELLQAAGHKGSYIQLNDLVNEVFPPVNTKIRPEYTDFNFWRPVLPDIPLPDFTPPSPALSARSDTSGRLSVLGKIAGIGRRSSKQPLLPTSSTNGELATAAAGTASSRPSSPLIGPAMTPDDLSEAEEEGRYSERRTRHASMPGSFEDENDFFPDAYKLRDAERGHAREFEDDAEGDSDDGEGQGQSRRDDSFDEEGIFEDDLLATGEMKNVPF